MQSPKVQLEQGCMCVCVVRGGGEAVIRKGIWAQIQDLRSNPSNPPEIGIPDFCIYFAHHIGLKRMRDLINWPLKSQTKFSPIYLQRVVFRSQQIMDKTVLASHIISPAEEGEFLRR